LAAPHLPKDAANLYTENLEQVRRERKIKKNHHPPGSPQKDGGSVITCFNQLLLALIS